MTADTAAPATVTRWVMTDQRRSLLLWSLALGAIAGLYISFYPMMGVDDMAAMVEQLPEAMINAFGYDDIASPAGYISSSVYGLLGPILLSVFAIATGTRLVAGQEEDGTLELELTAPVGRVQVLLERLVALWLNLVVLVGVLTITTMALVVMLDLDVALGNIAAASGGLLLLIAGFGTVGLAVGAISGRRAIGLGVAAGFAVGAYMLDAIGPTVDIEWMTAVSPYSWYIADRPLATGFEWPDLALLAAVPLLATVAAVVGFNRRDLMT
jgi:ABC-2 type transport system permease protein